KLSAALEIFPAKNYLLVARRRCGGPRETCKCPAMWRASQTHHCSRRMCIMFDLSPLYRSTVGFDRLGQLLDNVANFEAPTYPPYNIERIGEDEYRVTMAVAGFSTDDINIEVKENVLTVTGKKSDK